ncbi:hypothetical protein BV22DRAFT_1199737 [Leucogyrophana mollusca]|uniref:Uncharacterized protein n=1 Tax=Leucogyrophana mollusca TaxID=85980 RepID=A0ACB8AZN7_9AGAM|nr:hypothetical protein BV22DRAFT_1199737 [Leucogyrophana mollusca]
MIRIARRTRLYGTISQGHSTRKLPHDPQSQAAQSGTAPHDTPHAPSDASGNPDRIGFAEQVGSAGASAQEVAAPGLFSAVKQAMGFETNTDDAKQNKGRGEGVTGSGTNPTSSRRHHTSAILQATLRRRSRQKEPSETRTSISSTRRIRASIEYIIVHPDLATILHRGSNSATLSKYRRTRHSGKAFIHPAASPHKSKVAQALSEIQHPTDLSVSGILS